MELTESQKKELTILERKAVDIARKLNKDVYIVRLSCGNLDIITKKPLITKIIKTITP
jgi:hypothetical protein